MYRLRKAGISPKQAVKAWGFTPYTRELEENPTTPYAYGEREASRRLQKSKRFLETEIAS